MKRIISVLVLLSVFASALLCLISCDPVLPDNGGAGNSYVTKSKVISFAHFNTVSTIYAYGDISDAEFDGYVKAADETLEYYHKLFDIYFAYSGINNINTINRNAGKSPVKVDKALVDFLLYCKELYTLTEGKTNVMLGSVLKIWHNSREHAEETDGYLDPAYLPTRDVLAAAAEHTSIDSLIIDEVECTAYISDPEASIDVGAIGKGYAVDMLYSVLKEQGADSVALNIGGNLRTIGLKPGEGMWVTGITNPDKTAQDSLKCRIEIGSTSVVTSGDYERFFTSADKRYHHIIDPVTLMPAEYFSSVTIITENSGLADALSTALFCMPYEDGLELVSNIGGIDVIWIFKDGSTEITDGVIIK
jgi:thiamine biosynthesis lipoprotein